MHTAALYNIAGANRPRELRLTLRGTPDPLFYYNKHHMKKNSYEIKNIST